MAQFMVEFTIPSDPGEAFFELIPEQRTCINRLMEAGKILSYSLDAYRTRLWCITNAESEFEVMELIAEFPLIDFMTPTITPLMFHNSVFLSIPKFSVN